MRAEIVEMVMMIHIIQPNCLKSTPAIPVTIVNGKNTAIMVKVEATTEIATSCVACTAACFGEEPRSMCVVTFSSTTIASSTTLPIAIERHDREIMLSEPPVAYRYMNDAIRDIGIVITIIIVARHLPRKINTTRATKSMAKAIVSSREPIVFRMLSEVFTIIPSFTSGGRVFCSSGIFAITASEIATEFAPDCF